MPCSRCAFFTGSYHLKCTVHPCKALSEEAIGCLDYEPMPSKKPVPSPNKRCPKDARHLVYSLAIGNDVADENLMGVDYTAVD